MPIEIRELKISMTVDEGDARVQGIDADSLSRLKSEILEECMEALAEKVKTQKER
jgi:hypothetical protein